MLLRCIRAENRKLHASPIWFMFFILPIISAGYGTFNYLQNLEILRDGWYSLWTQHTLFYSLFFFPCMVAVYAAYLWRLEHIGHNWNLIMAEPVPPFYLFLAKLLVVTKLVLLTQAFVFVLYWFCGRVFAGFTAPPPAITIFYLVRSVLGGLAVVAGIPVVAEYAATGLVPRIPTMLGSLALAGCGALSFVTGLILDTVAKSHRRQWEIDVYKAMNGFYRE